MIERRTFLAGSAATAGALGVGAALARPAAATAADFPAAASSTSPFGHGIASGDPLPGAVVLWTRVTPTADALPGSGAGPRVTVGWQVATDPDFRRVVAHGSTVTGPDRDHTVKVDATGLAPATAYYYRFTLDRTSSPVGRTRTAPAPTSSPDRLRFALVSCSNWEAGYFSAYRHLAARGDLDAVLHMGDYVYEYGTGAVRPRPVEPRHPPPRAAPRDGEPGRLPAAPRAVQDRPRPAGPARGRAVDHHLGRPRERQRRLVRWRREPPARRGRLGHPQGRRAHRPTTSGCRSGSPARLSPATACRSTATCSSAGSPT